METLKENGKFYFSASELLKESQVRSFFCRLKCERHLIATRQSSANNVIIKNKLVKRASSHNDDEKFDSELEALEQDAQDTEIAVEENKILESFSMNAKMALESPLLMNSSSATSSTMSKKTNKA